MLLCAGGFWLLHAARLRFPRVQKLFLMAFASIMRDHEKNSLPGAAYFLLGCGLLALVASRPVLGAGILAISVGDPIASTAGVMLGRSAKQFGLYCHPTRARCTLPGVAAVQLWHSKSLVGMVAGAGASFVSIALYWGVLANSHEVSSALGLGVGSAHSCLAPPPQPPQPPLLGRTRQQHTAGATRSQKATHTTLRTSRKHIFSEVGHSHPRPPCH